MAVAGAAKNKKRPPQNTPSLRPQNSGPSGLTRTQEIILKNLIPYFAFKNPVRGAKKIKSYLTWFKAPSLQGMEKLFSAENAWVLNTVQNTYKTTAQPSLPGKKFKVSTEEKGEGAKSAREDTAYVLSWAMNRLGRQKHVSKRLLLETIQRAKTNRSHPMQESLLLGLKTSAGEDKKVSLQAFYKSYPQMVKGIEMIFGVELGGQDSSLKILLKKQRSKNPKLRMDQALIVLRLLIKKSHEKPQLDVKDLLQISYGATFNDMNSEAIQKNLAKLKAVGLPAVVVPAHTTCSVRTAFSKQCLSDEEKEATRQKKLEQLLKSTTRNRDKSIDSKAVRAFKQRQWEEIQRYNKANPGEPIQTKRNRSIQAEDKNPVAFNHNTVVSYGVAIGDDNSVLFNAYDISESDLKCFEISWLAQEFARMPSDVFDAQYIFDTQAYAANPEASINMQARAFDALYGHQYNDTGFEAGKYKQAVMVRFVYDPKNPEEKSFASLHQAHMIMAAHVDYTRANGCFSDNNATDYVVHKIYTFSEECGLISTPGRGEVTEQDRANVHFNIVTPRIVQFGQQLLHQNIYSKGPSLIVKPAHGYRPKDPSTRHTSYISFDDSANARKRGVPVNECKTYIQSDNTLGRLNSSLLAYYLATGKDLLTSEIRTRIATIHHYQTKMDTVPAKPLQLV